VPTPAQPIPANSFNVKCNEWKHGTSDVPVFLTISDPPGSFFVNFDYIPALIKNKKGTGNGYTCSSSSAQLKSGGGYYDSDPYHMVEAELNSYLLNNESELFKNSINDKINQSDYSLLLGYYPDYEDTIGAYNELLIKNALYMYLRGNESTNADYIYEKDNQEYIELLFNQGVNNTNRYERLVNDRLTFMEFFLRDEGIVIETQKEVANMAIINYPNPFSESTTISINTKTTGSYTLLVYDLQNRLVKTVFRDIVLEEGISEFNITLENQASGLYFGVLSACNKINHSFDGFIT